MSLLCFHGNKKGPDPLAGRAVFAHMKSLRLRSPGETGMTGSVCHSAGACFSKVPKLFGSLSGATIPFVSSQRRGSKPSNFAILLIFLILKTCKKISFSKQADCSLTTSFSGPKSSRDFRETGPRTGSKSTKSAVSNIQELTYEFSTWGLKVKRTGLYTMLNSL